MGCVQIEKHGRKIFHDENIMGEVPLTPRSDKLCLGEPAEYVVMVILSGFPP